MLKRLLVHFIEDRLQGISGPLGLRLRRAWYRRRFAACGAGLRIEPGVHIAGAAHIHLGENVWIDQGATLIAGPPRASARITSGSRGEGQLRIGSDCHIGLGTIIQAHGDVEIGDCFTSSAGCKLYSMSNDPAACHAGTTEFGRNDPAYRLSPIRIGRNVWLGLDVLVLGGEIGDDVFVQSQARVQSPLPAGQIAGGQPASALRPRFEAGGAP